MGCTIHGWVELVEKWGDGRETAYAIINISQIAGKYYPLFSALFGVRLYSPSRTPIAPSRGLPVYTSEVVRTEYQSWLDDGHSVSWILWDEILAANVPDEITRSSALPDEPVTLRDMADDEPGWRLLFDLITRLSENYPPDSIRLVAWFLG